MKEYIAGEGSVSNRVRYSCLLLWPGSPLITYLTYDEAKCAVQS